MVALTKSTWFEGPYSKHRRFYLQQIWDTAFSGNRSNSECFVYVACLTRGRYLVAYLAFSYFFIIYLFFTKIIIKMTMGLWILIQFLLNMLWDFLPDIVLFFSFYVWNSILRSITWPRMSVCVKSRWLAGTTEAKDMSLNYCNPIGLWLLFLHTHHHSKEINCKY